MTKVSSSVAQKPAEKPEVSTMAVVKTGNEASQQNDAVKQMTLDERIHRVESLQLMVSKRARLVQTRSELERFQIGSNDFNCQLNLKDSDGNVFTSTFSPGIKKVIDFLKASFDASIKEIENQITF